MLILDKHVIYLVTDGFSYRVMRSKGGKQLSSALHALCSKVGREVRVICAVPSSNKVTAKSINKRFAEFDAGQGWLRADSAILSFFHTRWSGLFLKVGNDCTTGFYRNPKKALDVVIMDNKNRLESSKRLQIVADTRQV